MLLFIGQTDAGEMPATQTFTGKIENYFTEDRIDVALQYGLKVIGVLVFLFIAWIAAGWTRRIFLRMLQKANLDLTLSRFIANSIKWVILILAVLVCLPIFGIETTSFAAILAAVGFAIGFALQGTLSNLAAGMMLLIFRPFKIDDVVKIGGEVGKVFEIDLFSTTLDTADNRRLIIPNGSIFGATIENLTFHPQRRVDVAVGTDYSADLEYVRGILEAAAKSLPEVLAEPEPAVVLLELGGSSIDWSVRAWANTSDYWAVRDGLTHAVKTALDENDIGIPFPQMAVHLPANAVK